MYKIIGKQEKTVKNLGGKGFNLIKLDELSLTPNFFVISSSFFDEYLKKDALLREYLRGNFSARADIKFIKKRILDFKFNKSFVAAINHALKQLNVNRFIVRSSFISEDSKDLSYAGLFDSYVCQKKSDIFLYIKKVWASQFNERVFSYQQKHNFKQGMAIIVQDFIKPDFSGVVFCQQNKQQESFIEYCADSYHGVESGKKSPYYCLQKGSYTFWDLPENRSHSGWMQELVDKIVILSKEKKISLDIEFAIRKNKIYLLQTRPLTQKIDVSGLYFVFNRHHRWKYNQEDFSVIVFKKILKELGIKNTVRVKKSNDNIFIEGGSYFSFFKEIKQKSKDLKFLDDFYSYFSKFILSQHIKTKKTSKNLLALISSAKDLNFKMSMIDYMHGLVIKSLKEYLINKYNINEKEHFEYFVPPVSFTTYCLLLHYSNDNKKIPDSYDKEILKRLDKRDLNKLIGKVKLNQKKVIKILENLKGKQKKYFIALKKLIWLRDMVDYYYDAITSFYGENIFLSLNKENIKHSFKDPLEICRFSIDEIRKSRQNKVCACHNFSIQKKQKKTYQEKITLPLKGIIASKGDFSGIAKIIKNFSDIKNITAKNILISQYTRPYLVVGMAICRGIITEEGGVTSHAAIVSRELGKPCLIGAQGCTRVLRNGDKIRVINGKVYKL